jgi:hypothetical protein
MYSQLYGPDYPEEDRTNLNWEENRIRSALADAISVTARREDVADWLRLADPCIVRGFEHFRKHDKNAASKEITSAIDYIRNAASRKPFKVDFVGRPDGTIERAPED